MKKNGRTCNPGVDTQQHNKVNDHGALNFSMGHV